MSASELAPFVAAVIEDGIVAEMKNKIEELESTIQHREDKNLEVQITGQNGYPIYGKQSLKTGSSFSNTLWDLDMMEKIDENKYKECSCPFDKESITQLEIRVGGIVLLKRFLMDDQYHCFRIETQHMTYCISNGTENINVKAPILNFEIRPVACNRNKSPFECIYARIGLASGLAATSSTSFVDDKINFSSSIKSLESLAPAGGFQLNRLLRHFDTLINGDDEGGGGTKLTMILEIIMFNKDSISGCISLMDELGVRTTSEDDETVTVRRG